MPDAPLISLFPDGGLDTGVTLYRGPEPVTTTLKEDLSDAEDETFFVNDATGAAIAGFAIIENEIVHYRSRLNHDRVMYLTRGQGGTAAAAHVAGVTVELHPVYYIPKAWQDAVLNLQSRVQALENP